MLALGEGSTELNRVLGSLWSESHLPCKYLSQGKDILLCPICSKVNRGALTECCSSLQRGRKRLRIGDKTHTDGRASLSQWKWTGQVREFRNKRDKTGISEELSRLLLPASFRSQSGKARREFRFCSPVNISSVVKKTWNTRPLGNCHSSTV